ncbi:MAG: preprotein translocase subunit SecY [FCB group bacterium]|nr:preprotein translocase subunit SecY [FCB group bacterium]MBL7120996.1 preprotein translocase subunit SecY [Candidatus Neomarinimicrobiota bacterium]
MIEKIKTVFRIPELRQRILFTFGIIAVFRLGSHVPLPGVDVEVLSAAIDNLQQGMQGFLGLFDLFAGGNFKKATVFAIGIMPYISASIILQLLGSVIPYFQKLQKEGEEGRKKITQLTRYATVLIATMQAWGIGIFLSSMEASIGGGTAQVVPDGGVGFMALTVITLVTGTVFLMWLGEQITERGIGNGISLIIMIGILVQLPQVIFKEIHYVQNDVHTIFTEILLIGILIAVVAGVILLTQGTRKIPVQYAKRVVGRKVYGGQSTHIPLRINTAGVMPIIFAQAILMLPGMVGTYFSESPWVGTMLRLFDYNHPVYLTIFGLFIVFFTYFYTAIAFNPIDVADNMKKQGGFIPGIRPGKRTAEYIDNILTRVTLPGAIALALIAVFPSIIVKFLNVDYDVASFFGGTSLLIMVGVALDTLQQVESHLLMRHYDGFMKSGKIRGRRRM